MQALLVVLAAAGAQLNYEAKVTTFACNSTSEVAELQSIRTDKAKFDTRLRQLLVLGECIAIAQGQVVDGSDVRKHPDVLRVGAKLAPPGFMTPKDDFSAMPADAVPPSGATSKIP
jgi:hypothetical protein